jgi:hypothetical protein
MDRFGYLFLGENNGCLVGVSASNLYASEEVAQLELPLHPGV